MAINKLFVFLSCAIVAVSSAGILETLLSWDLHETEGRSSMPQSKCLCQTSGCLCCVDLNLTSTIDLGGPACVNIKQKEDNVSLNLNYGDNPVHNATIKIADAANKPTCMNLLSDLAQLCAKFTSIKRHDQSDYDGCLVIEPALMRTPQATYHIGCFNFNNNVKQIQSTPIESTTETTEIPEEEDEDGINTDALIAAVSESAEQGIAFFSRWLGLNFNPGLNLTSNNKVQEVAASRQEISYDNNNNKNNNSNYNDNNTSTVRNGRMFDQYLTPQENSDERFKQLLSAQDNIVKESARIGHADEGRTTFVYAQQQKQLKQQTVDSPHKINLPIVPRESRRGGRAYNIHQHVNEV
ncbi:uncharacterized protein LOC103580686 [Microplitis demolitor]|uniref:uncharacterized protein LOC103580686 n=1 Tax=Microplitis demolitor TaxID=69319 RepID=UPI0004CD4795|nr:uncharacterized protein LOC103580686 [Microplitis demolitor]